MTISQTKDLEEKFEEFVFPSNPLNNRNLIEDILEFETPLNFDLNNFSLIINRGKLK